MGIGFVFIIYLLILGILVVPSMAIFAGLGYFLARKKSKRVKRIAILTAVTVPIGGCIYIVGCIIFMAIVGIASGRDAGFGDGFDLPLHNHYRWSAIDTTDSADVYDQQDKQATDGEGGTHIEENDRNAFANVLKLQEEGDWLAGAYGSNDSRFDNPPGKQVPDHWFLFNTSTHERIDAANENELQAYAVAHGFRLRLQSSENFYSSHRLIWIDGVAVVVLLVPLAGAVVLLWRFAKKLLREDEISTDVGQKDKINVP